MVVTKRKREREWEPLEKRLARTWCYYCEREFNNDREIIDHQKAKHYRCSQCGRRLNTVGGLYVHLEHVHKIKLTEVPNCTVESRRPVIREQEIFGMVGVPEHLIKARIAEISEAFHIEEAEYRAKTGNSLEDVRKVADPDVKKQKKEEVVKSNVASAKEQIARKRAELAAAKAAAAAGQAPPSASPGTPANTVDQTMADYTPPTAMQTPVSMEQSNGQPPLMPFNHGTQYNAPPPMYPPVYQNAHMQTQSPPGMPMYTPPNAAFSNPSFNHQSNGMPHMKQGAPQTSTLPPAQRHGLPPRPGSGYQAYQAAVPQGFGAALPQKMNRLPNPVSGSPNGPQITVPHQFSAMNGQRDSVKQSVGGGTAATPGRQGKKLVVGEIPDKEAARKALTHDLESGRAAQFTESFLNELGQQLDFTANAKHNVVPEPKHDEPSPAAGLLIKNNTVSWEERRAKRPRYHLPVSTIS